MEATDQPHGQFHLFWGFSSILDEYINTHPINNSTIGALITRLCDFTYPEANNIHL